MIVLCFLMKIMLLDLGLIFYKYVDKFIIFEANYFIMEQKKIKF